MRPYEEVYRLQKEELDATMWTMGVYVRSAVLNAVELNLAGEKAKSKYIEEPLMVAQRKAKSGLTDAEKIAEANAFFEKQEEYRSRWRAEHK